MNTNDLPPAARLAVLIEAGRAANPDLKQGVGWLYSRSQMTACALGFACLGAGIARDEVSYSEVGRIFGRDIRWAAYGDFIGGVEKANDCGASLDEIILSLREGELAKVTA